MNVTPLPPFLDSITAAVPDSRNLLRCILAVCPPVMRRLLLTRATLAPIAEYIFRCAVNGKVLPPAEFTALIAINVSRNLVRQIASIAVELKTSAYIRGVTFESEVIARYPDICASWCMMDGWECAKSVTCKAWPEGCNPHAPAVWHTRCGMRIAERWPRKSAASVPDFMQFRNLFYAMTAIDVSSSDNIGWLRATPVYARILRLWQTCDPTYRRERILRFYLAVMPELAINT